MSKYPRLLAFAQLLRLPNVFTAFADICLAGAATGAVTDRPGTFVLVLLASGCLYLAGMVLNDYFDRHEDAKARPFRPIPSGRVRQTTAFGLALLLVCIAVLLATIVSLPVNDPFPDTRKPMAIALILVAAILAYDGYLKRTPIGPLGMGLCRFLNVILGASAAGIDPWTPINIHLAGVVGVYIVGVTWFARTEEADSNRRQLRLAAAVMAVALLGGLALPVHFKPGTAPWYFPYLLTAFGFLVGLPVVRAVRRPDPKTVQSAVKRCVLGLIVLDAVLATAFVGLPGLLILLLLPPALVLGKWVYST
jgi:4-hydroxybenzoate polyprenyltransferase